MIRVVVTINEKQYEISELITSIEYSDQLNNGCSKLQFRYIPNEIIQITNGTKIWFEYEDSYIFSGRVFTIGCSKDGEVEVTAYDLLRYLKAKDAIVIYQDTIQTLIKRMCRYFKFPMGFVQNNNFVLQTGIAYDKTWLDIIYDAIIEIRTEQGKMFRLADEFGQITLRDLMDLRTKYVITNSNIRQPKEIYCTDYSYETSIDHDTYNYVKLVSEDKASGKLCEIDVGDKENVKKYGLLQYFEKEDSTSNASKMKNKANALLKIYNSETENLSFQCLGNTEIRAGVSLEARIDGICENKMMIVRKATHKYLPYHTMDLEVYTI